MTDSWIPVSFERTRGSAPILLICEHASSMIPTEFDNLGLDPSARISHVAWDIGGGDVARHLSDKLDAPLVSGGVSRLVYDCNRPPSAEDAIPEKSEIITVPGNTDLSEQDRAARALLIHDPFHAAVAGLLATHRDRIAAPVAVITVHSFTPIYFGQPRDVEIGFLHSDNPDISMAAQDIENRKGRYKTALNQPYSASDGVTYTLQKHGDANQLPSLMVEIRNDLVNTPAKAHAVADHLSETLHDAVTSVLKQAGGAQ